MIVFHVPGIPVPQGSMRGFVRGGRVAVTSDNPALRSWRRDVTDGAREAMAAAAPITGAIEMTLAFALPRPRSHYGTGRNAGVLRPSAPKRPTGKPDVDKLERAILDALTVAGTWIDDAQVVSIYAAKHYATERGPGVDIRVEELEP